MSRSFTKNRFGLVSAAVVLAIIEGFSFVRWLIFDGPKPDWQFPLGILFALWAFGKVAETVAESFERREDRRNNQLNDIETRLEALYKWGSIYSDDAEREEEGGGHDDDDLDADTKAKIAEYSKGIESGDFDYRYHLGVTYWNLAMKHYNPRTTDGYRKAIYWLRKAAKQDYDCENTLGDAYIELKDYDKAMFWYRRSVKRGGSLVWIAESNIADMYAEGQGVSQNHAEAARWWDMAAKHGSDWAHNKLGKLYAEGADGVEKDRRKAYFHLYIASSATGQHGPQASSIELREKVEKELGEYFVSQEKERAEEWLTAQKEVARQKTKSKVRPLPLPK